MRRRVQVTVEAFPLREVFTIARGSKREARVVVATVSDEGGATGRGEAVPYPRYNESVDGVVAAIEEVRGAIEKGANREDLGRLLPGGAARNALDCALWDLEAKRDGGAALRDLFPERRALETAFTISLGEPEAMAAAVRAVAGRPLLKIKVGGADGRDEARIRAVGAAAGGSRLIFDANEGWSEDKLASLLQAAAEAGAVLVEQPLPAGRDAMLAGVPHPVPVCADESLHGTRDLAALCDRYDSVNVKLDKTGGLTEAIALVAEARRLGFGVMVGCMVGTSLGIAPAVLLAQAADLVDLDGPLLLAADRPDGLRYEGSTVAPPGARLWG